jgi:tellurite resistance protein TehA-like permease
MNFDWFFNFCNKLKYCFTSEYLFATPAETLAFWFWFGTFILLLIMALFTYFYLRNKGKKLNPYLEFSKKFFWPNITLVLLGLFNVFSRYEGIAIFSWRFWGYLLLTIILTFNVWIFTARYNRLQEDLLKFHDQNRKAKWLKKKK